MSSTTVIHRKLADTPRSPRRRPAVDPQPRPVQEELETLAARVAALQPHWRDQELFHQQKSELAARLRALICKVRHD